MDRTNRNLLIAMRKQENRLILWSSIRHFRFVSFSCVNQGLMRLCNTVKIADILLKEPLKNPNL